jgi:Fur family transcriptional regulator, peroxide stress response regulator
LWLSETDTINKHTVKRLSFDSRFFVVSKQLQKYLDILPLQQYLFPGKNYSYLGFNMDNAKTNVKKRLDEFKAAARNAGIKVTHQRLEIFKAITASPDHPGADEIYRKIRRSLPTISLDTVYRTLWLLSELGLLKSLGLRGETIRFDANLHQHHHFTCIRCGLIRDFTNPELDAMSVPPEAKQYGSTLSFQVEIKGVCEDCLKKQPKTKTAKQTKSK